MKILTIFILALLCTTGAAVADLYSPLQGEAKGLYHYDEPAPLVVASIDKFGGTYRQYDIVVMIGAGSGDIQAAINMDIAIHMPVVSSGRSTKSSAEER